jgi:hypothetical protein
VGTFVVKEIKPSAESQAAPAIPPTRGRLILGAAVFVAGFCAPACIPLVAGSTLPIAWKTVISGLLALGIPELFMVFAVAILGKSGFEHLKSVLKRFMAQHGPPEVVGPRRYRVGLVMFTIPLLLAWAAPYGGHHLPAFESRPYIYALSGDALFVVSLFVLGGEFWDKLRSLFVHGARAQFPGRVGWEA